MTGSNSRLLVVDCETDEIPVVRRPVPVPRYDDAVLPGGGGGETENITFTWGQRGASVSDRDPPVCALTLLTFLRLAVRDKLCLDFVGSILIFPPGVQACHGGRTFRFIFHSRSVCPTGRLPRGWGVNL